MTNLEKMKETLINEGFVKKDIYTFDEFCIMSNRIFEEVSELESLGAASVFAAYVKNRFSNSYSMVVNMLKSAAPNPRERAHFMIWYDEFIYLSGYEIVDGDVYLIISDRTHENIMFCKLDNTWEGGSWMKNKILKMLWEMEL